MINGTGKDYKPVFLLGSTFNMTVTRMDWHPSQYREWLNLLKTWYICPLQSDSSFKATYLNLRQFRCSIRCLFWYGYRYLYRMSRSILWVVTGGNVDGCRASSSVACHYTQECAHCSHHRTPNYFNSILCRSFGVFSWLVNIFFMVCLRFPHFSCNKYSSILLSVIFISRLVGSKINTSRIGSLKHILECVLFQYLFFFFKTTNDRCYKS